MKFRYNSLSILENSEMYGCRVFRCSSNSQSNLKQRNRKSNHDKKPDINKPNEIPE